ncbi:MAG: hypothetical protein PF961_23945 [Planctomycetota bacterium]|jgi:hypothetical protein|nr:hypothetical protein [Planctomycetota bacterium]
MIAQFQHKDAGLIAFGVIVALIGIVACIGSFRIASERASMLSAIEAGSLTPALVTVTTLEIVTPGPSPDSEAQNEGEVSAYKASFAGDDISFFRFIDPDHLALISSWKESSTPVAAYRSDSDSWYIAELDRDLDTSGATLAGFVITLLGIAIAATPLIALRVLARRGTPSEPSDASEAETSEQAPPQG